MTLLPQENALGFSAGTIVSNGREGCPPLFPVPGFQAGRGHLSARRQQEGRSWERAPLLVLSPLTPPGPTCSAGTKLRSCKLALIGSEVNSV